MLAADAKRIVGPGPENTIRFWDLETGNEVDSLGSLEQAAWSVALAPNEKLMASSHRGGAVELWDLTTRAKKTLGQHSGDAYAVAFGPDGKLLVSTGQDALARVWTVEDGKLWKTLEGHKSGIPHVAFSPDGKTAGDGKLG